MKRGDVRMQEEPTNNEENDDIGGAIKSGTNSAKEKAKKLGETGKKFKAFVIRMAKDPVFRWTVIAIAGIGLFLVLIAGFAYVLDLIETDTSTSSFASAMEGTTTENGDTVVSIDVSIGGDSSSGYYYETVYTVSDDTLAYVNNWLAGKNIEISDANRDFIAALVENGYKLDSFGSKEKLEALFLFFKAQIASQSLDLRAESETYKNGTYTPPEYSLEDNKIQGVVRVQRLSANTNTTEDTSNFQNKFVYYKPYDEFNKMKNDKDSEIKNYFTLDDNEKLLIATTTITTTKISYNGNVPTGLQNSNTTDVSITTYGGGIDYKSLISKYSMSYDLLATLMIYLENIEFCTTLANSVYESSIALTLQEEKSKTQSTTTTKYKDITTEYYDFEWEASGTPNGSNQPQELFNGTKNNYSEVITLRNSYGWGSGTNQTTVGDEEFGGFGWHYNNWQYNLTYNKNQNNSYNVLLTMRNLGDATTISGEEKPLEWNADDGYTSQVTNGTYTETTEIASDYNTCKFYVSEVKNWYFDYEKTIEQYKKIENPLGPITRIEDELNPGEAGNDYHALTSDNIDFDTDPQIDRFKKERVPVGLSSVTWTFSDGKKYAETTNKKTEETYESNITKWIAEGETESVDFRNEEDDNSFLHYYDEFMIAGRMQSVEDWLFEQLEKNENITEQVDILKYLLYLYTGVDYGVTELDIEEFKPDLTPITNNNVYTSIGWEFTRAWENNDLRKYMNGKIEFADNNSLADWVDEDRKEYTCYTDSNGNLKFGFITYYQGTGITEQQKENNNYIKEELVNRGVINNSSDNITAGTTISVSIADPVGRSLWNKLRSEINNAVESLEFEPHQIDALTDLMYEGIGNIEDFSTTEEKESYFETTNNAFTSLRGAQRDKLYMEGQYYTPDNEYLDPEEYAGNSGGTEGTITINTPWGSADVLTYTSLTSGRTFRCYKQGGMPWSHLSAGSNDIERSGCMISAIATILTGYGVEINPGNLSYTRRYKYYLPI